MAAANSGVKKPMLKFNDAKIGINNNGGSSNSAKHNHRNSSSGGGRKTEGGGGEEEEEKGRGGGRGGMSFDFQGESDNEDEEDNRGDRSIPSKHAVKKLRAR